MSGATWRTRRRLPEVAQRYRLYPGPDQVAMLVRHCADARAVWNMALEQANCWRPGRSSSPGSAERFRQLAEARKDSWLADGSSSVQQQALRDFDQALKNFWAGSHRRPRWRRRGVATLLLPALKGRAPVASRFRWVHLSPRCRRSDQRPPEGNPRDLRPHWTGCQNPGHVPPGCRTPVGIPEGGTPQGAVPKGESPE